MTKWAALVSLLFGSTFAHAGETAGLPYTGRQVLIRAPAADFTMQDHVPGAPALLGAFARPSATGASIVTFAIETRADASPAELARATFASLRVKILTRSPFLWRGHEAYRVEYTDGSRLFVQAILPTPSGGVLVLNLQSPDAARFVVDRTLLDALLENGIAFRTGG